jgi:diacylglycerol kinase (ATP)
MTSIITTVPIYQSNTSEIILNVGNENILTKMTMGLLLMVNILVEDSRQHQASVSDGLLDIVILKDSGSMKIVDELVNLKETTAMRLMCPIFKQKKSP